MNIIDTHTHLYLKQFKEDIDLVINKSLEIGVKKFIFPAIDSSHFDDMHDLKNKYPDDIHLMSGLHPTSVKENYKEELEFVVDSINKYHYVAIGEIGIDLYWDKIYLKQQQEAFRVQIKLAVEHNLPIVIHCREAFDEVFEVLEQHRGVDLFGIFHCFTGTLEQAKRAIALNFKLGIGGVVTFKNGKIDQFLKEIPIEFILLETDAPYLAPVPHRGKRNESSYLTLIAEKVASCYAVSLDVIAQRTSENAVSIFKNQKINF